MPLLEPWILFCDSTIFIHEVPFEVDEFMCHFHKDYNSLTITKIINGNLNSNWFLLVWPNIHSKVRSQAIKTNYEIN